MTPQENAAADVESERDQACAALAAAEAERDQALAELHATTIAWDVALAALFRIHDRAALVPEHASLRTITEHALRAERWDDSVPPGGWVCAICGTPSESEPCPHHGHTGAPWCCDECKATATTNQTN